jgi:hypothetical protein
LRDVGLASAEITLHTGMLAKAKAIVKYNKLLKELNELAAADPIFGKDGKIFNMWQQAEETIYYMARADGKLSMNDFWKMNVYEFLRYKELLIKEIKLKKKNVRD